MKLKYYLRGLGIGIVVTALIMSIVTLTQKNTISDEEVIARAEKLGMVQSGVLSDDLSNDQNIETPEITQPVEEQQTEDVVEIPFGVVSENETEVVEVASTEPEKPVTEEKVEPEKPVTEEKTEPAETANTTAGNVTIQVNGGDGSRTVADRLKAAGLIDDATVFDDFLCKNGYDRHITTGKHIIKAGATYKEIAQNLTTKVN